VTVNTLEHQVAGDSLVTLAAWGLIVAALMQVVLSIPLGALEDGRGRCQPEPGLIKVVPQRLDLRYVGF
jgi:hypothetical protein